MNRGIDYVLHVLLELAHHRLISSNNFFEKKD
jgi:hypothetical protein